MICRTPNCRELPPVERDRLLVEIRELEPGAHLVTVGRQIALQGLGRGVRPCRVVEQEDEAVHGFRGHQLLRRGEMDAHHSVVVVLGVRAEDADNLEIQAVQRPVGGVEQDRGIVAGLQLQSRGDSFAEQDPVLVTGSEAASLRQDHIAAQAGFLVGVHALADHREVGSPVPEESRESQPGQDLENMAPAPQLLDQPIGIVDRVLKRRPPPEGFVAGASDLEMPETRVDRGLPQLDEDVLHESTRENQAGHSEADGGERERRAHALAEDVAEGELEHRFRV